MHIYLICQLTELAHRSFTFIYQLYKNRQKLHKGTANPQFLRVVRALCALCFISWAGVIIFLVGLYVYENDNLMRTLMFRITYSFTPIQFSACLVFMYSIKTLLNPAPRPTSALMGIGSKGAHTKDTLVSQTGSVMSQAQKTRVMADGEETLERPPTSNV